LRFASIVLAASFVLTGVIVVTDTVAAGPCDPNWDLCPTACGIDPFFTCTFVTDVEEIGRCAIPNVQDTVEQVGDTVEALVRQTSETAHEIKCFATNTLLKGIGTTNYVAHAAKKDADLMAAKYPRCVQTGNSFCYGYNPGAVASRTVENLAGMASACSNLNWQPYDGNCYYRRTDGW
jgi:hypothetical protein